MIEEVDAILRRSLGDKIPEEAKLCFDWDQMEEKVTGLHFIWADNEEIVNL
jgi:hypothetical protein